MSIQNPGNIKTQIGVCLIDIGDAIDQRDPEGIVDRTRYLIALTSPYTTPEQRTEMRPQVTDDTTADEAYTACLTALETLLPILAEQNVYAYTTPDIEDATFLTDFADDQDDDPAAGNGGPDVEDAIEAEP